MEFAASLRHAKELYKDDLRLKDMMDGELETDNMAYEDYRGPGDHWQFLDHFIKKLRIAPSNEGVNVAIKDYVAAVEELSPEDRAMTVFSREEELALIFEKIVSSNDWDAIGYGFYRHYLESHILFDSGDGGHHHLTQHFRLHESVLDKFYQIRLKLYMALFA